MRRRGHDTHPGSGSSDSEESLLMSSSSIEHRDGSGSSGGGGAVFFGRSRNIRATTAAMIGILIIVVVVLGAVAFTGISSLIAGGVIPRGATTGEVTTHSGNGDGVGSGATKPRNIPRRLIFTYKYNLLEPAEGYPPFNPNDPLTANVLHTMDVYRQFWEASDRLRAAAAASSSRGSRTPNTTAIAAPLIDRIDDVDHGGTATDVAFLSDDDCRRVINETEPRLLRHFNAESRGEFKADICRVADLYKNGGLYFDIDIRVVNPLDLWGLLPPPPTRNMPVPPRGVPVPPVPAVGGDGKASDDGIITFSSIRNTAGRFFQAFTASMPGHPILKSSLNLMVDYYEGTLVDDAAGYYMDKATNEYKKRPTPSRNDTQGMGVGPFTLSMAFRSTTDEEWKDFALGKNTSIRDGGGGGSGDEPERRNVGKLITPQKYSRILYEVSLDDENVVASGLWKNIPPQDKDFKKKNRFCNFVCYEKGNVYFYSRVVGSKGCPLENK